MADQCATDQPADPGATCGLGFHLAEHYLRPLLPATTLDYLTPLVSHSLRCAGQPEHRACRLARSKVRILAAGQPLLPPVIDPEVQRIVTLALLQTGGKLAVRYRPRSAVQDKEYEASPLGLVVRDQVIYLVCTLREYADVKQLVLNRSSVSRVAVQTSASFAHNLDPYIASGEFGISLNVGLSIKLVADFSREAALTFLERPLATDQTVEKLARKHCG